MVDNVYLSELLLEVKTFRLILSNSISFVIKYAKIRKKVTGKSSHILKIFLSITGTKRFSSIYLPAHLVLPFLHPLAAYYYYY